MSSNGLTVTVVGWAATTPREVLGEGVPFTSFRVATTPRRYDNRAGAWTDGRTEWITVKVFRDVAYNVASSVHKGEPVVVVGRLLTEDWVGGDGPRTGLVLEATALGHDLTKGNARFARTVRTTPSTAPDDEAPGDAAPPGGPDAGELDDPWAREAAAGEGVGTEPALTTP